MADRSVVVRLIADTGSYEQGMRRASGATDGLNQSGRRTLVTLGDLGKIAGTFVAGSVLKAGVSFNSLKQTSQAAFTTMLGSASAARGELSKLYDFALKTPFAYPMILQAAQQMKAYGMATADIIPTLKAVGDATAAMGGSAEIFQRVTTAIGQIQAKGTVQAEEFRQLAEAGIPAWQTLANYLGVSVPQAMQMVEKRMVSAKEGINALREGIETQFGGAMDALGNTWKRSVDRFVSSARRMGGEIMEPLMAKAQQGMASLTQVMNKLGPVLGSSLSMLAGIATPLGALIGLLGKLPGFATMGALALLGVHLAAGKLNAIIPAVKAQWGSFGAQMRVQQSLAAMSGQSLSRLGAAATVAGMRVRAAGASMMSAFGGPIGIAITAVTLGLGFYAQRQAQAKQKAAEHKATVDELTASLDKNTLALTENGRAEIESKLAKDKLNTSGKSTIDTLRQLGLNATLYASAMAEGAKSPDFSATVTQLQGVLSAQVKASDGWKDIQASGRGMADVLDYIIAPTDRAKESLGNLARMGDRGAQAMLDLAQNKSVRQVAELYGNLSSQAKDLAKSQKDTADAMSIRVPAAAKAIGDSSGLVQSAFNQWRSSGGSLSDALKAVGLNSTQVTSVLGALKAETDSVAAGLDNAASAAATAAAQFRQAIAQSAASFVSPVGAWDAVVQRKQAAMSGGGGAPKAPKLGDNPAVKAATAVAKAYKRQMDEQNRVAKAAEKDAKAFAAAEKKKADAAKKAADALKRAADSANSALTKAQDRKAKADQEAADAANILAAVQHAALQAGTADTLAWQSAVEKAQRADVTAKAEQAAATVALDQAQKTATDTTAKLKAANDANTKAQADSTAAQNRAAAATTAAQRVKDQTAARYQKLLDAQHKVEDKARASTQNMASGGAGAVAGMVKDVKVSLAEYLTELHNQVKAQLEWKNNLLTLAAKVPPGVLLELAKLGPGAAPLVAQLVRGTKTQLDQFSRDFILSTETGVKGMQDEITTGGPLIAAVAKTAGTNAALALANGIKSGKVDIKTAMKVLQGVVDDNTLAVKLGLDNPKDLKAAIQRLLNGIALTFSNQSVRGSGFNDLRNLKGQAIVLQGRVIGLKSGGWVKGGSGTRDDVPVANGVWGMGGEYMVRKSIAQANKPFFDYLDRHGRMPDPVASSPSVFVNLPPQAPADQRTFNVTIVQQPGQDPRGVVWELDRQTDLASKR